MKKFFSLLAGLMAFCSVSFAQGFNNFGEGVSELTHFPISESEKFEFSGLSYIGVGFHAPFNPVSNDFLQHTSFFKNVEFYFNLAEVQFHPYDGGSVSLGVDLDWDYFNLERDSFWMPDDITHTQVSVLPAVSEMKTVKKSRLSVMSFNFPLSFEHQIGSWSFRAGVTAEINLHGIVRTKGIDAKNDSKTIEYYSNHILTRVFTHSYMVAASYGGLGLYVRYNPSSPFRYGCGPDFSSVTFGLVFGFGM